MRWVFFILILANIVAAYWFDVGENHRAALREKQHKFVEEKPYPVKTLVLLGERGATERVASVQEKSVMPPGSGPHEIETELVEPGLTVSTSEEIIPVEDDPDCTLIGPFVDQPLALEIQGRIAALNLDVDLLQNERVVHQDYWVIIPPKTTKGEAEVILLELQQKKIDSFIIEDGEYQNGITLGVFSNQSNAEEYHREIITQGYQANVKPLLRQIKEYWLEMLKQDAEGLSGEFWSDVGLRAGGAVIKVKHGFCGELSLDPQQLNEGT